MPLLVKAFALTFRQLMDRPFDNLPDYPRRPRLEFVVDLVWLKYWSEASISSIENLICGDHCPGSSSETGLIAQAKVYGNWLASSPAVIVVNNASVLA